MASGVYSGRTAFMSTAAKIVLRMAMIQTTEIVVLLERAVVTSAMRE